MKIHIRHTAVCLLLFFVTPPLYPANAQTQVVTLEKVLESVFRDHPVLTISEQEIARAKGERIAAGQIPNPLLRYNREDLSGDSGNGGEDILSLEMPLEFLWKRGPQVQEAEALIEGAASSAIRDRSQLRYEVREAYITYHFAIQNYLNYKSASEIISRVLNVARERSEQGDISKYAGATYQPVANPVWGLLGAGIGAAGSIYSGSLAGQGGATGQQPGFWDMFNSDTG